MDVVEGDLVAKVAKVAKELVELRAGATKQHLSQHALEQNLNAMETTVSVIVREIQLLRDQMDALSQVKTHRPPPPRKDGFHILPVHRSMPDRRGDGFGMLSALRSMPERRAEINPKKRDASMDEDAGEHKMEQDEVGEEVDMS
jgi:hypothetical protein